MLWYILRFTTFIYALLSISFWILTLFYPDFDKAVGKLSALLALLVFVAVFVSISLWYLGTWVITHRRPMMYDVNDEIALMRRDITSLNTTVNSTINEIITSIASIQREIKGINRRLTILERKNEQTKKASRKNAKRKK
jgi:hypothetical protein